MSKSQSDAAPVAAEVRPRIPPQAIAGAVSKLLSASIGDIAVVFSKSAAHKHYTFADLEWMILPAVMTGQFYVGELEHKELGARAPVAAVLWASVSDEVDARLAASAGKRIRLRPDEWRSGDHLWIVDVAGPPEIVAGCLKHLAETALANARVRLSLRDAEGVPSVVDLKEALAQARSQ